MTAVSERVPLIAVASGKGGVGKTTTAVNLALALAAQGAQVGLADADIYGPDVPRMLGLVRRRDTSAITISGVAGRVNSKLEVVRRHGLQLASAAFLLGQSQGIAVGGGLAQLIVRRLIDDTAWEAPDYIVVDLPPGTADVQQFVFALPGARMFVLVVATPQVIAHQDVRRLVADLRRRRIAGIGGVENMSSQICSHCGQRTPLFPAAPSSESIWQVVPKITEIPYSYEVARGADEGRPGYLTAESPDQVTAYNLLAAHISEFFRAEDHPPPTDKLA